MVILIAALVGLVALCIYDTTTGNYGKRVRRERKTLREQWDAEHDAGITVPFDPATGLSEPTSAQIRQMAQRYRNRQLLSE